MKQSILVAEDDPAIAFGLKMDLETDGYAAEIADNGETALSRADNGAFDLLLLDVMLPVKDGFDVCRELRRRGRTLPIILVTALAHEAEVVMGLELGADDYVTKPFSPRVLRARVKAALRKMDTDDREPLTFGDLDVDLDRGEIRKAGRVVGMTALEYKLLSVFVRHRGRLLSRNQLLDLAWGPGTFVTERVVDNHVVSLRRKIETDPAQPKHVVNVRGLGYRFET